MTLNRQQQRWRAVIITQSLVTNILTYRIIFGLVDVCMSDYFQLMSADGDRTVTRGNPFKLSVIYCRAMTRKNFLANMW